MDTEQGCQDVDECNAGQKVHKCNPDTQFCINTDGSHRCMKCDKSCKGCIADGPDSCNECANGYVFQKNKEGDDDGHGTGGICITEKEAAEKEKEALNAQDQNEDLSTSEEEKDENIIEKKDEL